MAQKEPKIIQPYEGFQRRFVQSNLDFVIGGGAVGGGKTTAAVLSVAEGSLDGRFRALFLRNNLGDLKSGGGILDTFKAVYGDAVSVIESGDPHVDFVQTGARVDVTHVTDQSKEKIKQRFKGRQYDYIYFDEGTGFTWDCFTTIYTRNRGQASWTGKVRMTTNPKRSHWLRTFLDWYIDIEGNINPEREGVVRYFYVNGDTVNDVVWGNTKLEVYQKCKGSIDKILNIYNKKHDIFSYEDVIKSFTFYQGRMDENQALVGSNKKYIGSVAVQGGSDRDADLNGNWDTDEDASGEALLTYSEVESVFDNDPQRNNDRWVTCDLATTGKDNFIALAWDGFHIIDIVIANRSTPRENAEQIAMLAASYDIAESHIIYDGINGIYINDYIPEAKPFFSYNAPQGMYRFNAYKLKDECYLRLIEAIQRRYISFAPEVAKRQYKHVNLKDRISVEQEFISEALVIRFRDMPSGKKNLYSKRELNAKLGKGRSMDLCDPIAMRFFPVLNYPYGEELQRTTNQINEEQNDMYSGMRVNVYDETLWC